MVTQRSSLLMFAAWLFFGTAPVFAQSYSVGGSAQYFNLLIAWNDSYSASHPEVKMGFKDLNRKDAFDALKNSKVDMVLIERPVDVSPSLIQVPVALSAIAVIYNVPGLKSPLKLKPEVLYGLLNGSIKTWNHEKLAADNPALKTINEPVLPSFYIAPHGLTDLMSSYLMKFSGPQKEGGKSNFSIRSGIGVNNAMGMIDFVKQNPGSIGFVDIQQLQIHKVQVASLQNQAGQWVNLESEAIQKAASQIARVLNGDFKTVVVNPPGLSSYPLSFLVYAVVTKSLSKERRLQLAQFLRWGLGNGDPVMKKLGLPTLPLLVKETVDRYLARSFSGPQSPN